MRGNIRGHERDARASFCPVIVGICFSSLNLNIQKISYAVASVPLIPIQTSYNLNLTKNPRHPLFYLVINSQRLIIDSLTLENESSTLVFESFILVRESLRMKKDSLILVVEYKRVVVES